MSSILIVMGVSGCGKSTVGIELAKRLKIKFIEGDEVHPESNIRKMSSGIPLNDEDRLPWILSLREKSVKLVEEANLQNSTSSNELRSPIAVITCSALKSSHRDILRGLHPNLSPISSVQIKTYFIYLKGSSRLIKNRMKSREDHFMGFEMLDSQIQTLEEPHPEIESSINNSMITLSLESSHENQPKELKEIIEEILIKLKHEGCSSESISSNSSRRLSPIEKVIGHQAEPNESRRSLSLLFEVSESIEKSLIPLLKNMKSSCETYEELILICQKIVEIEFDLEDRVNFLSSHPRIGEIHGLSQISATEQQNHKPTDPKVLKELERLNRVYETTYPGLRYVTFVNGRSREEIMNEMQNKLYANGTLQDPLMIHDRDEEWHIELARGISNVFKIAVNRLGVLQKE
ncbi:OHCU decarboxylase-domain-containing protein [Melampsora americana]|nr:OHCU decarboxylase-domain-containing protein [Melampsora americana]